MGTTTTGGSTLPPELVEKSVERLGWVGLIYAITHVVMHFLNTYVYRADVVNQRLASGFVWYTILGVLLGLLIFLLARSHKIGPTLMLDIGLLFEVGAALLISMAESLMPYPPDYVIRGHSAIAIWVVFFTLIVPTSTGKAALAALATAMMGPIGLAINILAHDLPTPAMPQWLMLHTTPFLMGFWAVLLSRYVYNLGAQMGRARELGSYDLKEILGRGGMGEVWRAKHRLLVHEAAIKVIRPEALFGDSVDQTNAARRRFEREAQATAALHSPHTVALYDYGVADDGSFYYVMELLEGLDLDRLIERFGPMPANRAVSLLRQICDSLAEAHSAGLIHRDIKPKNIFTCRLGLNYDFIKVLDFGLVKVRSDPDQSRLTREGVTTGTPAFMPPEMALGESEVDPRTDLYAVGCVAYWLLSGHLVFEASTPLAMALEHVKSIPIPVAERSELEIPPELDRIVMQCLEKNPSNRPHSARQLSRMLAAVPLEEWTEDAAEQWWRLHIPESVPVGSDTMAAVINDFATPAESRLRE